MKTLKTKKVNVVICWNGLKNTPPKDFPSIEEMDKTAGILDLLKEATPEFAKVLEEGEKMNTDIQSGKLESDEKIMKAKTEFSKKSVLLEEKSGEDIVEISFENADFNAFFQQFERWGRVWFIRLEPYLEFRKSMNVTNAQPKQKGK